MIDAGIRSIIEMMGVKYGLDPDLIEAFCMQESSGDPGAVRVEFGFYERYTKPLNYSDTEEVCRAMSWGLMQIMGETARGMGYQGKWLTGLLDPEINLDYCCRYLKGRLDKYGYEKGIASYNSGKPRYNPNGTLVNQKYVDGVLGHLKNIKGG